jgi:hypothetical protein
VNSVLTRLWCVVAMAAALCVLSPLAAATMVPTDQAIGQSVAEQDRARVRTFFERADAREQLRAMGVDDLAAKERVARLTDHEVHMLAQKIESLPAGGNLSNKEVIAIVLIVALVVLLI